MQFWKTKAFSYLSGAWLYRWYALAIAWAVCLAGWAAVAAIPDKYQVEARVYVDTDTLMAPLLRGLAVTVDTGSRIAFMLNTLITRPNLEQVIRLTDPQANNMGAATLQQRVTALQSNVVLRPLQTRNYYAIGFTDNNSDYAQSVTQTLLSILLDSNIGDKRRDMESARSFIDGQISEYESRLREAEKRRADFRTANLDIIGKAAAPNRLDAVSQELDTARKDLSTAIAKRDTLRDQINMTPRSVAMDEALLLSSMNAGGAAGANNANMSPLQRLQAAKRSLDDMLLRYTQLHPDVISMKKYIAELEVQAAQPAASSDSGEELMQGVPNPVFVQLRTKLAEEEMNVAVQRQRVATASAELDDAKNTSAKAIEILTQYSDLDRDYGNIERTYQELLKSREAASLSQAIDDQSQQITFRVIEPPQRSEFPASPNRWLLNTLVLLAGIGGGIAVAVLLSINSGRFITSDDLTAEFGVPVIGVVTRLKQAAEINTQRVSTIALTASVALLLVCFAGVLTFLQVSLYTVLGA